MARRRKGGKKIISRIDRGRAGTHVWYKTGTMVAYRKGSSKPTVHRKKRRR